MSKRKTLGIVLFILSLLLIYLGFFSKDRRYTKNMQDFLDVKAFSSETVSVEHLKNFDIETKSFYFGEKSRKDTDGYQNLGTVYMYDKSGEVINEFELFENNGNYIIYMRGVYLSVEYSK